MRKRADRLYSRAWYAGLRAANRWSRRPVTGAAPVTVSLTSYGARVDAVAYTVESIAWGRVRPRRIVLWLDEVDRIADPPPALRRLMARGLEVLPTDNLGPHKKYYPLVVSTTTDEPFVTADDDVLYPRYWLDRLVRAGREQPGMVNCYRASDVLLGPDGLAPYDDWPRCTHTRPGRTVFATGVAGIWYPAAMTAALRAAGDGFRHTAPMADDIWLHHVALRAGVRIRQIHRRPRHFWAIPGSQAVSLMADNVQGGRNDRYLAALYTPDDVAALRGPVAVRPPEEHT